MTAHPPQDRRRHPRLALQRACKLHRPDWSRFLPATLLDISRSGARAELRPGGPWPGLEPGHRLELLIDWDQRGVLARAALTPGRLVRLDHHARPGARHTPAPSEPPRPLTPARPDAASEPMRIAIAFDRLIELRPEVFGAVVPADQWLRSWSA